MIVSKKKTHSSYPSLFPIFSIEIVSFFLSLKIKLSYVQNKFIESKLYQTDYIKLDFKKRKKLTLYNT